MFSRPINAEVVDTSDIDLDRLDKMLLDQNNRMKLLSIEDYRALSVLELRAWGSLLTIRDKAANRWRKSGTTIITK